MDIKSIREMDKTEITEKIISSKRELLNLRIQLANHRLKDNTQLKKARKRVAQLKTVLKEKGN